MHLASLADAEALQRVRELCLVCRFSGSFHTTALRGEDEPRRALVTRIGLSADQASARAGRRACLSPYGDPHRDRELDLPLEAIAFFGYGMRTGAGSILNEFRPPAGSRVAISGTAASGTRQ